jgi:hypothetical protein
MDALVRESRRVWTWSKGQVSRGGDISEKTYQWDSGESQRKGEKEERDKEETAGFLLYAGAVALPLLSNFPAYGRIQV